MTDEEKEVISPSEKPTWPATEEEGELAVDVYSLKDEFVIQAIVGGVKASDLDISITNDMITIRGRRERKEEGKIEKVYYNECFWGPFSRTIILPQEIDADKAKATLKEGLLTIHLPKFVKTERKTLRVKEE